MANEVREVENTKDNTAKSSEDNQVSYLSVISDIGKSAVLGGIGCAAAAGIGEACKTATGSESALKTSMKIGTAVAESAVLGVVPALTLAAARTETVQKAAAAANGAVEAAKAGANAVLGEKCTDIAKDIAIGAVIGGAIGACAGDSTRAAAATAVSGIAAGARKVMEDCCCKSKTLTPLEAVKQMGRDTWDHMKNRPLEAVAEGLLLGPAGIMAGAAVHKMMDKKDCCNPAEVNKKLNEKINDRPDVIKDLLKNPFIVPVVSPIGMPPMIPNEVLKRAAKSVGTGQMIDTEAARETIKKINQDLDQHRKDNPTASVIERSVGYAVGGVVGGKMVGTAIEMTDIGYRKAYDYVKSWFK